MTQKLRAVGQVTEPNSALAGLRHQILPRILLDDDGREPIEADHSGRVGQFGAKGARFLFPAQDHAASRLLRAWTRIVASAAGVIPRRRLASASVAGRAASSRSIISRDKPGIAA